MIGLLDIYNMNPIHISNNETGGIQITGFIVFE